MQPRDAGGADSRRHLQQASDFAFVSEREHDFDGAWSGAHRGRALRAGRRPDLAPFAIHLQVTEEQPFDAVQQNRRDGFIREGTVQDRPVITDQFVVFDQKSVKGCQSATVQSNVRNLVAMLFP